MAKITRALISVSDKTGIVEFSRELAGYGVEILSTGGTAKLLREAGLNVKDVSEFTGFPEMLDGRVKTLHPKVHGGLLGMRSNPEHVAKMKEHGIENIDMVVVNLYPFEATVAKEGCHLEDAIENIDIGGPTMLRSAAKNYPDVTVLVDCADYARVLDEMKASGGKVSAATNFGLAVKVFQHTAAYDGAISNYLGARLDKGRRLPGHLHHPGQKGPGPALRRKPPADGGLLCGKGCRRAVCFHRGPAAGQGAFLQQHHRPGRGHRDGQGIRAVGGGHHQAHQPLRRSPGGFPAQRLPQGPRMRSGLGLRRHCRLQPHGGCRHGQGTDLDLPGSGYRPRLQRRGPGHLHRQKERPRHAGAAAVRVPCRRHTT